MLAVAAPAAAQEAADPGALPRSPILTIEPDIVFAQSQFGQRVAEELEARSAALAAENRAIEAELGAEEQQLTDERPTLPPEEFRTRAEAFDEKVQRIRREQDAKEAALERSADEARGVFLTAARPVLADLMRERGAAAILDRRSVFLAFGAIDITDEAIERIDARIGRGEEFALPDGSQPPGDRNGATDAAE